MVAEGGLTEKQSLGEVAVAAKRLDPSSLVQLLFFWRQDHHIISQPPHLLPTPCHRAFPAPIRPSPVMHIIPVNLPSFAPLYVPR